MVVRMKMAGLQLLFVALLSTSVIVAEDLDPVEFLISKNKNPRNKSLIPLPKDFDKFGDQKNDCCALQLFIEVKDYNAEGTGNGDNESQTETGSVTFNFEHPEIRKSDIKFTMSVGKDKDKVKSKHLLNFDNCTNIIYKTFNISATTTIADDKDVRLVLVNGKDAKIVCTDPKSAPDPRDHYISIEKPPCAVPCLDTDSWCEERGACIDKDEHCDCGPDKIYCTSEDAYSCESRKGILQSHIFNICRNGECRKNCTMAEEEEMEGCGEGQFRCGGRCLDNVDVVQFKTCNKQCISVHKTCYAKQEEVSVAINDSEKGFSSDWIYFICIGVIILVCFGVICLLYYRVQSNSKRIQYLNNTTTDLKNISEDSATYNIPLDYCYLKIRHTM